MPSPAVADDKDLICNTGSPCAYIRGGLSSLEIPIQQKKSFANGDTELMAELPASKCWYLGQEIVLYSLNTAKLPTYWGRGELQSLTGPLNQLVGRIHVTEHAIADEILAPECFGACERVLRELPPPGEGRVLVDLRSPSRRQIVPIASSQNIPFAPGQAAGQFSFWHLPANKDTELILIPENNRIQNSQLLALFRMIREKGWKKVSWFYPGADGLSGYEQPLRIPVGLEVINPADFKNLSPTESQFFFVGRRQDYRPVNLGALPVSTAFIEHRPGHASPANPFRKRGFAGNFTFPKKMPPLGTTLIVFEKDATEGHKHQAAEALISMGYFRVKILRGGLAALREAGFLESK